MPGRIEGQSDVSQFQQLESAQPSDVKEAQQAAPTVQVNRAEQAKQDEITYAQGNPLANGRIRDAIANIPTPGSMEIEGLALVQLNGARVKVTIDRDESGEFTVKTSGGVQGGFHLFGEAEAGVDGAMTWKQRTPEGVADLVTSLGAINLPLVDGIATRRVAQLSEEGLRSFSIGGHGTTGLRTELPAVLGEGVVGGRVNVTIDLDRRALIVDQSISGELVARGGAIFGAANLGGEVRGTVRSEIQLPPDVLERVKSGELSVKDAILGAHQNVSLVLEAEGQGQFTSVITPFTASEQHKTEQREFEAVIDLNKAVQRLSSKEVTAALQSGAFEKLGDCIEAKVTSKHSTNTMGYELQYAIGEARAMAVQFKKVVTPLIGEGSGESMHHQLEAQRLQSAVAR
ncbi:MAG: hypothetical protein U0228_03260 [Myxococcaceae bacterium]